MMLPKALHSMRFATLVSAAGVFLLVLAGTYMVFHNERSYRETKLQQVGAQAAIWNLLKDARARGMGILLISADLDELIGLSDTLEVMLRGRLVATLDPASVTPEQLGGYMTGARTEAGAA